MAVTMSIPADGSDPVSCEETRQILLSSAKRGFGAIPEDIIVERVLSATRRGDFPVREAALEALERRWGFAERDGLAVATRPVHGGVLGVYTTARGGGSKKPGKGKALARGQKRARREPRPYMTQLESLRPLAGSCDCPDFVRSSLGVCKHLLVVAHDVCANRNRLAQALSAQPPRPTAPRLDWEPELPLVGDMDRLRGLRLMEPASKARLKGSSQARWEVLRGWFQDGQLRESVLGKCTGRQSMLSELAALVAPAKGAALLESSPAARRIVSEELDRARRRVEHESAMAETLRHLRSLRRKLYPYQREGVERIIQAGRLLLADDMGLGKTTQAIAACHALFGAQRIRRGLVIAPASLKPQWLREWEDTTDIPAAIVEGSPEERIRQYRGLKKGFLIINYEQLLRDAEAILLMAPELVILDEAQRIKNYASKTAIYVKALQPEFRLVLTGTPMENRLEELASILDWVDDVALSPKWRLVPWYTMWDGDGSNAGKSGARHLDTLRARLDGCLVRRVRHDVLKQLPPRTDTRVPVEMTPQQVEEHDALAQPIASLIRRGKHRPLTQPEFLKLMSLLTQQRIICNGLGQRHFDDIWPAYQNVSPDASLLQGLFAPKLEKLRELVEDLVGDQQRKVVIFSQWRKMLRLANWSIGDILSRLGQRAVFFTGGERPAQRTKSVAEFHDDPRVSIMFLSDAGGIGLNLQRAASACINLELPWNPAVLEQRIGRIYRLGQTQPIDVYNLVSEYGIEPRILSLVSTKQALFTSVFDGTSDEVSFDAAASFLTRVERLVDPGQLAEAPSVPEDDGASLVVEGSDDADVPAVEDEVEGDLVERTETAPTPVAVPVAEPGGELSPASLLARLRVERTESGGIRIEASPEVAQSLLGLFEEMAKLLSKVSGAGRREE
jgi:hypothetical protein